MDRCCVRFGSSGDVGSTPPLAEVAAPASRTEAPGGSSAIVSEAVVVDQVVP